MAAGFREESQPLPFFYVSLDKILHLGIKDKHIYFALRSIFRIFAAKTKQKRCNH